MNTSGTISDKKQLDFESLVRTNFAFLEQAQMSFLGVRVSGGTDQRDSALVARYVRSDWRLDVGWNEFELSLSLLIKLEKPDWPRQQRYFYFEPFIEFVTRGNEKALAPYITERMSVRSMKFAMARRKECFANGLAPVMATLGQKLKRFLHTILSVSQEEIKDYHVWVASER